MTLPAWGLALGLPVVLLLGLPALVLWTVGHLPSPRAAIATVVADGGAPPRELRCAELRRRGLDRFPRAVGAHFPAAGHQICRDHCGAFARRRRRDERAVVLYGTAIGRHIRGWCPYCAS